MVSLAGASGFRYVQSAFHYLPEHDDVYDTTFLAVLPELPNAFTREDHDPVHSHVHCRHLV